MLTPMGFHYLHCHPQGLQSTEKSRSGTPTDRRYGNELSVPDIGENPVERDSELSKTPAGPDPASMSVTPATPLPFTSSSWLPSKQLENCRVEKAHISVNLLLRNRQSTVTTDSQSLCEKNKAILQWTT